MAAIFLRNGKWCRESMFEANLISIRAPFHNQERNIKIIDKGHITGALATKDLRNHILANV
jgi:hypothetical protein